MPFIDYEVVDAGLVSESSGTLVKANLPYKAMIGVEFYGDGDGSRVDVYSTGNFSLDDTPLTHGWVNNGVAGAPYDALSNMVASGGSVFYNSSNLGGGRVSLRIHLFYLPDNV